MKRVSILIILLSFASSSLSQLIDDESPYDVSIVQLFNVGNEKIDTSYLVRASSRCFSFNLVLAESKLRDNPNVDISELEESQKFFVLVGIALIREELKKGGGDNVELAGSRFNRESDMHIGVYTEWLHNSFISQGAYVEMSESATREQLHCDALLVRLREITGS